MKISKGFSALFVVVVLGGVALSLALALSTSAIWSIRGSVDAKTSNQAKALANACAEVALETLRENNAYVGTSTLTLDGQTCAFSVLFLGGTERRIEVTATVGDIVRKLAVITGAFNPLVVSSWQEVP